MKIMKKLSVFLLIFIVILTLIGCELSTDDYSALCDDNDENCAEYSEYYGESDSLDDEESTSNLTPAPNPDPNETPNPSETPNLPSNPTSKAGEAIADYARMLYNDRRNEFRYISPSAAGADEYRINTYNDVKSNGYLTTDCNGFVGYVIHKSLGIGPKKATKVSQVKFAYPSGNTWKSNESHVKVIAKGLTLSEALESAKVGDLLASNGESTHIQIYIGNGRVIDNTLKGASIALRGKGASKSILHEKDKFTILRVEL